MVEIGQKIGFCGTKYLNPKSWVFLKHPKSINGSPELIFGRSGSNEDSILASDTVLPRVMRMFLVVILASRAVFRPIFDHRVPTRTLEMRTHEWSLTLRSSTEVIFCHEILSFVTGNGRIGSLRRKSSPRVTESVYN